MCVTLSAYVFMHRKVLKESLEIETINWKIWTQ